MSELPEPLVPAEVDLRGLPWMPVDTVRLLDSDTWALSTGDQFKAAFKLWCKAWQQVPAGSLPDDDVVLASLSGTGRMWAKFRPVALRGFVKCSDGRLYHPVIASKALEAWQHRLDHREESDARADRQRRWRERCRDISKQLRLLGVTPPKGASLEALERLLLESTSNAPVDVYVDGGEIGKKGTVTGRVTGQDKKPTEKQLPSAAARRAADTPVTAIVWNAYAKAYHDRYGVEPLRNAKVNGMLAQFLNRVPAAEAPDIAAFYVRHPKGLYMSARHCVDLLLRDAEGLRTEWATGSRVTDTGARQADRTAARGELALELLAENRKTA